MDTTAETPRWIRARDLTRRLGVHRVTLYRWVATGAFPAPKRLGGTRSVFWSLAEVEIWEAKQCEVCGPARPHGPTG